MSNHTQHESIGLVETLGMVPAIEAADKMLKAANVTLCGYENVGSTLVTIMVQGDLSAVHAAVESGATAASAIGKVTAHNVMPRPIQAVHTIAQQYATTQTPTDANDRYMALGFIETFGIIYLLEAADAMTKAADVELIGFENVGSGYISVVVRGDVGACSAAVEAGREAVIAKQAEVYSSLVLPAPHPDIYQILNNYRLDTPS